MTAASAADSKRAAAAAAEQALSAPRNDAVGRVKRPPKSAVLPDKPVIDLTWGDKILGPFEQYGISLPTLSATTALPLIAGAVLLKKFVNVNPLIGRVLVGLAIVASVVFIARAFFYRAKIEKDVAEKQKATASQEDSKRYQRAVEVYYAIKSGSNHALQCVLKGIPPKEVPEVLATPVHGLIAQVIADKSGNKQTKAILQKYQLAMTIPDDKAAE